MTTMNNKLISIIVPVYNVEKYLEKCIRSICDQTYKHLQIIIIDDGATDSSGELADKLAIEDSRIEVHHKENGGLSSARNEGLRYIRGEYVMFIDSDDYIDSDMCEKLMNTAILTDSQLVECGYKRVYGDRIELEQPSETRITISGRDATKAYLIQEYHIKSAVVVSLYKKEIFNNIRFVEGRLHEDGWFKYLALYASKRVTLIPDCLYYYVQQRPGSIMTTTIKEKNVRDVLDAFAERWHYFERVGDIELAGVAKKVYVHNLLSYHYMVSAKITDKVVADNLVKEIRTEIMPFKHEILFSKEMRSIRLKFLLYYYFPYLTTIISNARFK